uniref:Uncharacterized protein n=1 Tax=Candidatus Kentrum sp. LFY TaxID=2126342 RepID=A0A450WXV5_9GAMM|nr:MAG: hypothetical protein BECKLFY1418C_GA0070996_11057 [Candidatus Kentron sp. LFY]
MSSAEGRAASNGGSSSSSRITLTFSLWKIQIMGGYIDDAVMDPGIELDGSHGDLFLNAHFELHTLN